MKRTEFLGHFLHFLFCVLVGLAVGVPLAIVGANSFAHIAIYGSVLGAIIGMLAGYPIGVFIGVVLFGKLQKIKGSIGWALFATIIGSVIFVSVFEIFKFMPAVLWSYFFISFPIITIAGYNRRLWKK